MIHKEGKEYSASIGFFSNKWYQQLVGASFYCVIEMKQSDGMIKLNSSNYSTWMRLMEDLLYCKDLYKPIKVKDTHSTVNYEELGSST